MQMHKTSIQVAMVTHLCIVELFLEQSDIKAVFVPGVEHKRFTHFSCRAVHLNAEVHD